MVDLIYIISVICNGIINFEGLIKKFNYHKIQHTC